MPRDEDASADAARSQDFRRFTVTLDNSRQRNRESRPEPSGSSWHVTAGEYFSFSVLQAQQSNAHVSTSTSMTRPQPAPHSIAVPHRSQLPFQQLDNERAGRVGSDAKKMYSRYADLSERRSAKKSGCKLNLQITRTTIVSVIAVSVAKEKADLFSKMMMPPGHTNGQQSRPIGCARSLWRVRRPGLSPQGRRAGYAHRPACAQHRGLSRHRAGSESSRRVSTPAPQPTNVSSILGVFAELETNLRKERQLEGIASAKARGVDKGARQASTRRRSSR